ncbi:MAG: M20/M25/M40 family metallo-hydrolase [Actinomycetia bacterium]|nr:M20/M25/M40 family metallo-hydrolase [Actinomycetes bacterium]
MSSEIVELLQTLIQNACVNTGAADSGQEHRSVATLQAFFGVDGAVFEPAPGRQSLVYRVAGTDPGAPSLALVPHLDVVPADPSGWTQDPFGGEIIDGYVYGRGAVDMLNLVSAFAYVARPYIRGDLKPRGDLVFAAVADEEAGGGKGAHPLVRDHWDLVGADYLLTEIAYPSAGAGQNIPVTVGEKGSFYSHLETTGVPGHASAPYGADNALHKMIVALQNLLDNPPPPSIGPQWIEFVDGIGLEPQLANHLKDPDRLEQALADITHTDPMFAGYVHASTHLTVTATRADAGIKSNIIADKARAELDIRALPGTTRDDVNTYLRSAMGAAAPAVEIEAKGNLPATISSTQAGLWGAIADSVHDLYGHRRLVPTLMPGATDARFWRQRGSVAYGVGICDDRTTFSDLLARFHGHDERISVESLERTSELYGHVLHHLNQPR